MLDKSWQGLSPARKHDTLISKENELFRLRQKRKGLEIDLTTVDRQIRKLDAEANDIRASLGITPEA